MRLLDDNFIRIRMGEFWDDDHREDAPLFINCEGKLKKNKKGEFSTKSRNSYIGWIRQNPGIHPSYPFCDFSFKNDNLGSKLKF